MSGINGNGHMAAGGLALLREPFKANQISSLPKPYKKDSPKGKCQECGGYHGLPAIHLDYVGHAALTDRLLDADPSWTWEPVADPKSLGLPVADGMWIRLTVCGVTRFGFGCADGKSGGDAVKEMIGDALRNAAMRFGAALDLWHKGTLHEDEGADATPVPEAQPLKRIDLPPGAYQVLEAKSAQWGGEVIVVDANGEEFFHKTADKQVLDFCKVARQDAVPVTLEFAEITRGVNKGKQKLVAVHRVGVVVTPASAEPVELPPGLTADQIPF